MSFLELAKSRWTCRKYDPRPVEQEKVDAILEAARVAPSAKNRQPAHVWALQSEQALERANHTTRCIYGAPLAFIVAYAPDEAYVRDDGKNFGEIDASIVGTHMMMEAADQGLGSTWIGAYDAAKLHEEFPEIDGYVDVALFAVGYPAQDAHPADRHELRKNQEEVVVTL